MPNVVNGIGTWYYGKENIHKHCALCEHCNQYGELKSYDTRSWFVIVFIPVIPLDKKRITDHCPHCDKHYAADWKEWEENRATSLLSAVKDYEKEPFSADKAKIGLSVAIANQAAEEFSMLAGTIRQNIHQNAELQLLLASGYDYFGNDAEAEQCYKSSIVLEDKAETREAFAAFLMQKRRPNEARPYLVHIKDEQKRELLGYLTLLAAAFQAEGNHITALEVLDDCLAVAPEWQTDKYFCKLQKISQKHAATGKPIVSDNIAGFIPGKKASGGLHPLVIVFIILALIFAGYAWRSHYLASAREIYLVNGLERGYGIQINGKNVYLKPLSHTKTHAEEGEITVAVLDEELPIERQTCRIEHSFWVRPLISSSYVINPDKVAILYTERTLYSTKSTSSSFDARQKVRVGQFLYKFENTDYHFREFPNTVTLKNKSKAIKRRLAQFRPQSSSEAISIVNSYLSEEIYQQYIIDNVRLKPQDETFTAMLLSVLSADKVAELLRPFLAQRPLFYNYHAAYQTAMSSAHPEHDLQAEYRKYLQQEPENSALLTLLARLTIGPGETEKLLLQAIDVQFPHRYAYYELARMRWNDGLFDEAWQHLQKALKLDPDGITFRNLDTELKYALQKYDELLRENEKARKDAPYDISLAVEFVLLLIEKGEKEKAQVYISGYSKQLRDIYQDNQKELNLYVEYLQAVYLYNTGDRQNAYDLIIATKEIQENAQYLANFGIGNWQEASAAIEKSSSSKEHMVMFVAAKYTANEDLATHHLDRTIQILRGEGDLELVNMLSGTEETTTERVCSVQLRPDLKRIFLTAMGMRFPQEQKKYFALARKLNYKLGSVRLFLRKILH